jgi:uncharacterized protein (DUF302 family)
MPSANGLIEFPSSYGVDESVSRLQAAFEQHGLKVFAVIDHSGEASQAGLAMPNTKVVLFGSPKAGTPLMVASPTLAIDLPLKVLLAEDETGHTTASMNDPEYLQQRHGIPPGLIKNIAGATALVRNALQA